MDIATNQIFQQLYIQIIILIAAEFIFIFVGFHIIAMKNKKIVSQKDTIFYNYITYKLFRYLGFVAWAKSS